MSNLFFSTEQEDVSNKLAEVDGSYTFSDSDADVLRGKEADDGRISGLKKSIAATVEELIFASADLILVTAKELILAPKDLIAITAKELILALTDLIVVTVEELIAVTVKMIFTPKVQLTKNSLINE